MIRTVVALVVEVLLVVAVALLLSALWQWFLTGDLGSAALEGARLLFFFMDVGLAAWVVVLVVLAVRRRALPGVGPTLLGAFAAVVLNALVVLIVGLVQGGWAALYVMFALTAGLAFLVAVLIVAPIVRRLFGGVPAASSPSASGGAPLA